MLAFIVTERTDEMAFRKFETVETAAGTRYLLDGEEVRHVVGCELEPLDAECSRYRLTLEVAVSNYSVRCDHETGERDRSYHQLRVKMEGNFAESVQLDDRDMLFGLVGFGLRSYTKEHDGVATFLLLVKTDEETAKRYGKDKRQ